MAVFKCKMCGGTLEVNNETVTTCSYCGTQQTLPRLDDEKKAQMYDRANHFRRNNDYDKAMGVYEQILNEDRTDAEAYWSILLCRYGIEYVVDPTTKKRIPTVNRAQFTSVFDDEDYKSAMQYAEASQKSIYEAEASAINDIQKGILAISQKEEPFDVFICYKETDNNGRRTPDSVLATELYHELVRDGFKVFFARITLEDKLGSAYEPYIFAALNSARVMVVLGTMSEYFNAVWVKNEWSRYLSLIKKGEKKMLIPAYKDMDPYDLPDEFSHLQAQDMSKLGFMQDLIRGIKKIVQENAPVNTAVKETVVINNEGNANITALIKRGYMALEDGEWARADDFFEQALNQNAELVEAYLGKLMAELHVTAVEGLKDVAEPFDNSSNFQKVMRFGDEPLKETLVGYIQYINERNEKTHFTEVYREAKRLMGYSTEDRVRKAYELFDSISGYLDSDECLKACESRLEEVKNEKAAYNHQTAKSNKAIFALYMVFVISCLIGSITIMYLTMEGTIPFFVLMGSVLFLISSLFPFLCTRYYFKAEIRKEIVWKCVISISAIIGLVILNMLFSGMYSDVYRNRPWDYEAPCVFLVAINLISCILPFCKYKSASQNR